MFEGILLIIFFIIGGLALLLAIYFFVMALVRKSKGMLYFGIGTLIIPIFLYALTFWFYDIHIPSLNKNEEKKYVGIYTSDTGKEITEDGLSDKNIFKLILNSDNTFQLDKNEYFNFDGKGTWEAGETDDGQFTFKVNNSILFWATPINGNKLEVEKNSVSSGKITFYKN